MLAAKRAQDEATMKEKEKRVEANLQKAKATAKSDEGNAGTYASSLNDIVKLELLLKQDPATISEIWNTYHSTRNAISASLDSSFYQKLYQRSKQYPMVKS
jgi:ATP synthase F1 complex assembly factor 1